MSGPEIVALSDVEARRRSGELAGLLSDVVEGGGGVSFMAPFPPAAALPFWEGVIAGLAADRLVLLAALLDGEIAGSVQLHLMWQPNQPHRAEVAKLLVRTRARRRGIARSLMQRLEEEALSRGRTLVTLDTEVGGAADRLYRSLGYTAVGTIPAFALRPHGGLVGTTIFYKQLA